MSSVEVTQRARQRVDDVGETARLRPRLALGGKEGHAQSHVAHGSRRERGDDRPTTGRRPR